MLYSQCLPYLCLQISLSNIVKFRKKNWRFDIVGGLVYFILVFSLFPQCKIDTVTQQVWPALPAPRLFVDGGGSFLGFRTKLGRCLGSRPSAESSKKSLSARIRGHLRPPWSHRRDPFCDQMLVQRLHSRSRSDRGEIRTQVNKNGHSTRFW